jgi:hypothetical protein
VRDDHADLWCCLCQGKYEVYTGDGPILRSPKVGSRPSAPNASRVCGML